MKVLFEYMKATNIFHSINFRNKNVAFQKSEKNIKNDFKKQVFDLHSYPKKLKMNIVKWTAILANFVRK